MHVLPECICSHCVCLVPVRSTEGIRSLDLELQEVVSHYVDAGN